MPGTTAPPPAMARVKVVLLIVVGSIGALKVALAVAFTGTLIAALAGVVAVIVGATTTGASPVVKFQVKFAAKGVPVRFCAAVVIVAV
jgi:hypothetical protein